MNGGGPGSGIWRSADGGETWTRFKGNGLPDGPLGRIGLDLSRKRPNILYALIEGPVPAPGRGGTPDETPQAGGRGAETSTTVTSSATGLYRSDDSGSSWKKVNDENPRPMYFSQVRIDPNDPDIIIYAGVKLHHSTDAGKTVTLNATRTIHDDVHAIWIDPANSQHVIIGTDGGVAVSWDQTKTWNFIPNIPVGLFYHVSVDNATPFNICGGMQDNYSWCGPSAVRGSAGLAGFHWMTVQGGDGFVALQDPNDYRTAYSESQDGNMVRVDRVTGETVTMRPVAGPGEQPYRWNWDTPLIMSPHNASVIFAGANRVFRSSNRGQTWEAVGGDLTTNANREDILTMGVKGSDTTIAKNDGIVAWGTVISLAESPKRPNLLYAGTDDGNVQVSRDGKQWVNVTANIPNLPKGIWVSEVVPSRFDEGTVYATFDGHRQNDFETYIYVSRDFGQTWQPANGNLKGQTVKTLTEDPKNPDLLYIGTETGPFVSIDRAKTWTRVKANLPTVRIDEIAIQPRDNAMVLATHGRALWILDHLEPIQEYAAAQAASTDARLFTPPPYAMYRRPARDRNYEFWGDQVFNGENPPSAAVISWLNRKPVGEVKLKITDAVGKDVREIGGSVIAKSTGAGIQTACWDLRVEPAPAPPAANTGQGRAAGGGRRGGRGEPQGTTTEDTTAARPGAAATQATAAQPAQESSPFGAGCAAPTGFGGGGFGGGVNTTGPLVLSGSYKVSLIVDGKTVDTKPLRITDDPDVALTAIEKKRMFDQAMEMQTLQARVTDAAVAYRSLAQQVAELATTVSGRSDVPGDVKAGVDALKKDLDALTPRLTIPQGGRGGGGGRGGQPESLLARIGQAKQGLMAGMAPGEQTTTAYADAKAQAPKAIADLNAAIAKATTVASSLSRFNLTLNVPQPVKAVETPASRRTSTGPKG
jgi:photosystem II stability/assembly factor-like uncharacterized protein